MTACHLIADGNLTFLSDVAAYYFINAGTELVAVFSCKHFDVYYYAVFAVRYAKGSIANLSCLFAEYCAEKSLLGSKLRLALRRYLTDKYITRVNLGTDTDYAVFVKVGKSVFTDVRDISRNIFRSEFGISRLKLIFLYMN